MNLYKYIFIGFFHFTMFFFGLSIIYIGIVTQLEAMSISQAIYPYVKNETQTIFDNLNTNKYMYSFVEDNKNKICNTKLPNVLNNNLETNTISYSDALKNKYTLYIIFGIILICSLSTLIIFFMCDIFKYKASFFVELTIVALLMAGIEGMFFGLVTFQYRSFINKY